MAVLKVNQRGAIVIMTVFFVIILIAFAALALDLGRLYVLRTDMQNAADAAALAGAVELNGKPGARGRAVEAATKLLSHKGQFSTSPELLKQLASYWKPDDPENSTFVFYSWIGAEPDPAAWDCNKSTESWEGGDTGPRLKCITTDDIDARYIRVKLDPELTTAEKKDYGIDFYFLPVLSLVTGSPITEGFTKVMAIAGNTDSTYCNMPPLMICAPPGGFDENLSVGQQVLLKTQGPGSTWLPGDFAFLYPVQCETGDSDCSIPTQLNKALISQLAQEQELGCTPPEVTPLPGNRQATAYAVNTRLGLYGYRGEG
ncbi:MAG: Tad domain-containing protein [Dehalococcoidia bacterium]